MNDTQGIYLIRHGETMWNKIFRFQGATDTELSENGLCQARKLAQRFSGHKFAAIYASDLKRASTTAQTVAQPHALEIIPEPRFREMSFGEWEGLDISYMEEKWPGKMKEFFRDPASFAVPGGESLAAFNARVCPAFYEIIARHEGQDIMIVAHGGSIRAIIADILKTPPASFWAIRIDNTAVNTIHITNGRFFLSALNDTAHLTK